MYSSSCSRVKLGPEARQPLYRNKGKSCGYYMRIIFFFSSLIQSLIIVSLVLLLIYGQPEKSAEEERVKKLELEFNKLSTDNMKLTKEKVELGAKLAACSAEKTALQKEMAKQQAEANFTKFRFNSQKSIAPMRCPPCLPPPTYIHNTKCQELIRNETALVKSNVNQMVQNLLSQRDNAFRDRDNAIRDRDNVFRDRDVHLMEVRKLHGDKTLQEEKLTTYRRKCKEDFVQALSGIQTVTTKFLNKIDNLFPHSLTFHLTCKSQKEQLETIKSNCTNLSRDVENKFQPYLDHVGEKMTEVQWRSSQLEVQNSDLTSKLRQCEDKYKTAVAKATMDLDEQQKLHDQQLTTLLREKIDQEQQLAQKDTEIQALRQTLPSKAGRPNAAFLQTVPQQGR
ncbi:plasmalemma vesicle associated protein b isoform X1 [Xiphophorus hellerii]|uniref:plasmalemma vesicle associated protein b isoform X1 n=1 Tax=Xiphophorus hellerii TaxID=8084 RepID=UPI0013B3C555|nr:plasmalemma vesicle-associated protein-like isoform X1 [Xiphophorus hellerii]XP_032428816.1 plasmalemma vesicle-associated protein-like isoform X1 [Xiphophorus hellerii]